RGPQRLLAAHCSPRAADEDAEAVMQARRHLTRRQHAHPRRGELDGERDTVEALTDLRHVDGRVSGDGEVGTHPPCPVDEQLDRPRHVTLPTAPDGSRLVTRTATVGPCRNSSTANAEVASRRCSQLSITTNSCRSDTNPVSAAIASVRSGMPRARSTAAGTAW